MHYLPDGTLIPNLDHRGADRRERSPRRGPEERHLQAARRRHLGRRRAADRRRRRLHLGVGHRSGQRLRLRGRLRDRSSRWRSSIRRRYRSSSPIRTPTGSSRTPAAIWGSVYPKHVLDVEDGKAAHDAFLLNPVGTGPYKVESFSPNDQVIYVINENYREANKPFFAKVNLKGGGDAASAARAVLQTGDYDYAWNLQVEPDVLAELEQGGKGVVAASRPAPRSSASRSSSPTGTPRSTGRRPRRAPSTRPWATRRCARRSTWPSQRDVISQQLYAGEEFEPPTANILTGIPAMDLAQHFLGVQRREGEANPGRGRLGDGRRRPREGRRRAEHHLRHLDQPGAPEGAGDHQAGAGGDRLQGRAAAGRRRRLLRRLRRQRAEHQPLLQRPADVHRTTPPRRSRWPT